MLTIDKYAYNNRIVTWSPQIKGVLWLFGMIIAFQPLWELKVIWLLLVAMHTIYVTRVSVSQYLKWFYVVLPFLLLSIIGIIFTVADSQTDMLTSLKMGGYYWGISKTMLPKGIQLTAQVSCAIVCTYWFSLTTPFRQILDLLKALHFPKLMIEEILLIYRFIFIFIDSFEQIHKAQDLRFGYMGFKTSINSLSMLIKLLFDQVIINYRHMINALDAKLYDGEFHL